MTSAEASPLTTASADSLDLYFSADPLSLDDKQLSTLVLELRRRRNAFASDESAKAAAGKSKRPKATIQSAPEAAAMDKPVGELSLDDLA